MNKRSFLNQAIFGDFFVVTGGTQITSATTINFKVSTEGTTYVKNINILDTPTSGNSTDSILVRDSNGIIKIITQSNISGVDNYVTGGTFNSGNGTLTLERQNGFVTVTGFTTGTGLDTYVTGFTYDNANTVTLTQNNGQLPLSITINSFTGLTINGSVSATTYYGDGSNLTGLITTDYFVTGGTFDSGTGTLTLNRQNGSVNVTGFTTGTGLDTYVTGFTYDNNSYQLTILQNQGQQPLSVIISTPPSSVQLFNYYNFI